MVGESGKVAGAQGAADLPAVGDAEGDHPVTPQASEGFKSERTNKGDEGAAALTAPPEEAPLAAKRVNFPAGTFRKKASSASIASKSAKPTVPIGMFRNKHVFVELHEFNQDHWQQTHRWNHGLQEKLHPDLAPKPPPKTPEHDSEGRYDLKRDISSITDTTQISHLGPLAPGSAPWTRPRLPSVSLLGLYAFRDSLDAGLIHLDVTLDDAREPPCKFVAEKMLEHLRAKGYVTPGMEQLAQAAFVQKLSSIKETAVVACAFSVHEEKHEKQSPVKGYENPVDSDGEDDIDKAQNLEKVDPLKPEAEEEIVHVLVDTAEWLERDAVCFTRFSSDVRVGLEEDQGEKLQVNSRFLVICLAGSKSEGLAAWLQPGSKGDRLQRHVQIGEAAAVMFQDERVVQAAYGAIRPRELLDAFDAVLADLKIVPKAKLPDEDAILKRAKKMLDQMTRLASTKSYNQNERWALAQRRAFDNNCSISSLLAFMQTFALPLLSGIALALFLANSYPVFYDRWAGVGPALEDAGAHRRLGGGGAEDTRPNIFGFEVHGHPVTLHFLVNDILMCLFFGLAGKEITEALQPGGSLYPPTRTTINVLAGTAGGVLGPIVVYLLFVTIAYSVGLLDDSLPLEEYAIGWGVPTATDISLAWVTAICVFGAGHPAINYLLLLAIIDDGIGLLIIAFAYPDKNNPMKPQYLALVAAAVMVSYILRRLKCARWQLYVLLAGPLSWFGLLYTGLHPALALVFVVPFIPLHVESDILTTKHWSDGGAADHGGGGAHASKHKRGRHPLHEYEESVKNFIDFGVLFLFGAVNAGVSIDGAGWLTVIVLLSLVVGKTLGIYLTSWVATCCGCPPPTGMTKTSVASVGFIASAGLTVALFVSGEAFSEAPELATQSKMGALLSAVVAFVAIGFSLVQARINKKRRDEEAKQKAQELGVISTDTVNSLRRVSADTALEDMVVNNAVKSLNFIHDATDAIENKTGMPRWKTLEMLKASMMLQESDEEV